jgi:transcriptional regulator with XRE-family HTH domain
MVDQGKRPRLVGAFIRQRREALGLSQRALGQLFSPTVTTQFISNVERGVTPLPPAHVPTLTQALLVSEAELLSLLEREYTVKLTGRLGNSRDTDVPENGAPTQPGTPSLTVATGDFDFIRSLYDAYRQADQKTRQTFMTVCGSILNLRS